MHTNNEENTPNLPYKVHLHNSLICMFLYIHFLFHSKKVKMLWSRTINKEKNIQEYENELKYTIHLFSKIKYIWRLLGQFFSYIDYLVYYFILKLFGIKIYDCISETLFMSGYAYIIVSCTPLNKCLGRLN